MTTNIGGRLSDTINFGNVTGGIYVFILINVTGVLSARILRGKATVYATIVFFCLTGRKVDVLRGSTTVKVPVPTGLQSVLVRLSSRGGLPNGSRGPRSSGGARRWMGVKQHKSNFLHHSRVGRRSE